MWENVTIERKNLPGTSGLIAKSVKYGNEVSFSSCKIKFERRRGSNFMFKSSIYIYDQRTHRKLYNTITLASYRDYLGATNYESKDREDTGFYIYIHTPLLIPSFPLAEFLFTFRIAATKRKYRYAKLWNKCRSILAKV